MDDGVDEEQAPQGTWTDRFRAKWRNGERRRHWIEYLVPRVFSLERGFVQGDSYPEFRAQRTNEGGGFTWLRAATEGR
jgi:hypothetical protein